MNNSSENNAAATPDPQQDWGVLLLDPQLNIRYINPTAAEILLSSTEQATNKHISALIPTVDSALANARIFSEANHYSQSIAANNSASSIPYQLELHSIPSDNKQSIIIAYIYKHPASSAIDKQPTDRKSVV